MTGPDLAIGMTASRTRTFSPSMIESYRSLVGDTGLAPGGVPGPLLAGMISDLLGTELPGEGTMWMKQRMVLPAPATPGEEVVAIVEVVRLRPAKNLVNLATTCRCCGTTVLAGEALVLVPDLESRLR